MGCRRSARHLVSKPAASGPGRFTSTEIDRIPIECRSLDEVVCPRFEPLCDLFVIRPAIFGSRLTVLVFRSSGVQFLFCGVWRPRDWPRTSPRTAGIIFRDDSQSAYGSFKIGSINRDEDLMVLMQLVPTLAWRNVIIAGTLLS